MTAVDDVGDVVVYLMSAACTVDDNCVWLHSSVHVGEFVSTWRVLGTTPILGCNLQNGSQSYRKMTETDGDSPHERLVKMSRHSE